MFFNNTVIIMMDLSGSQNEQWHTCHTCLLCICGHDGQLHIFWFSSYVFITLVKLWHVKISWYRAWMTLRNAMGVCVRHLFIFPSHILLPHHFSLVFVRATNLLRCSCWSQMHWVPLLFFSQALPASVPWIPWRSLKNQAGARASWEVWKYLALMG